MLSLLQQDSAVKQISLNRCIVLSLSYGKMPHEQGKFIFIYFRKRSLFFFHMEAFFKHSTSPYADVFLANSSTMIWS